MSAKRADTSTVNITLRVKESLRASLEAAAKAHGVSLNTEIADRLEHGRDRVGLLEEVLTLAYGRELAAILMVLGAVMSVEGKLRAGGDWTADADAYAGAMEAATEALQALRPNAPTKAKLTDHAAWLHAASIVHTFAPNPPERIKGLMDRLDAIQQALSGGRKRG